jgi:hypothetical protein
VCMGTSQRDCANQTSLNSSYISYSLISTTTKPTHSLYDLSGRMAREVKTKTEFNAAVRAGSDVTVATAS